MDANGGMFSNLSGSSGMLGLEMSLNPNQPQLQQPLPPQQSSSNLLHRHHHQQPPYASDPARHPPPGAKQAYPYAPKPRNSPLSDDDELPNSNSNHTATEDSGGDGKMTKGSPWQRMKWTDNMVRLLIMVVFYIGDDVATEAASDQTAKKKGGAGSSGGGGVLQKKGKWKSVSRAMMERGFYVSPQQCEDKFNDLNKRYKRVNDILGKGTACKVVENQSLLETMDLPPKMKEEAKKLLNSKHLFFREMCAYHNSTCGGGSGSAGNHHSSPPEVTAPTQAQQQKCLHSNAKNVLVSRSNEDDDGEEDEEEDDDSAENTHHHYHHQEEDDDEDDGFSKRKRGRNNDTHEHLNCTNNSSVLLQQFGMEVSNVTQDVTKSVREKRQWMKAKMVQLEEQKVGLEGEGFELEKQRLKWVKFSYKKEREMEVERLRNERRKLENDRMVILLKQKVLELVDPSSITG